MSRITSCWAEAANTMVVCNQTAVCICQARTDLISIIKMMFLAFSKEPVLKSPRATFSQLARRYIFDGLHGVSKLFEAIVGQLPNPGLHPSVIDHGGNTYQPNSAKQNQEVRRLKWFAAPKVLSGLHALAVPCLGNKSSAADYETQLIIMSLAPEHVGC